MHSPVDHEVNGMSETFSAIGTVTRFFMANFVNLQFGLILKSFTAFYTFKRVVSFERLVDKVSLR